MQKHKKLPVFLCAIALCMLCLMAGGFGAAFASGEDTLQIKIISTSDVHGKLLPYDYEQNIPSAAGSLSQISSAVRKITDENTVLIDVGDTVQGNMAELFIHDAVHPMVRAQNLMKYDVWVPGNHEFDYGMDVLENVIRQHECHVLCANVHYRNGTCLGQPYVILERSGVKIGIIGLVTPNITRWDRTHLDEAQLTVEDPVLEAARYAKELRDQVDILIAACHMGFNNEYGTEDSGTAELADKVPELDLILAAHGHKPKYDRKDDVLMTQNKDAGQTMNLVVLTLEKEADRGYRLAESTSEIIETGEYPEDPEISSDPLILEADRRAKAYTDSVVVRLNNESLAPENEIPGIAQSKLEDTTLLHLIHDTQMYYTGASISATALYSDTANLYRGDIKRCDIAKMYTYPNMLCKVRMTGKQLTRWIEHSCMYYNTFREGDLTISFNPAIRPEGYVMFGGVKYEIDISMPPGNRVKNLRLADGTALNPEEKYDIATNNYIANADLLEPGIVFTQEDGFPEMLEMNVGSRFGGLRGLIGEYLREVKGIQNADGAITCSLEEVTPESANWKLTGWSWDAEKHTLAAQLVRSGKLEIENSPDGRYTNIRSLTEADLSAASVPVSADE